MKGCICHFVKWQIHPFISKVKSYYNSCHLINLKKPCKKTQFLFSCWWVVFNKYKYLETCNKLSLLEYRALVCGVCGDIIVCFSRILLRLIWVLVEWGVQPMLCSPYPPTCQWSHHHIFSLLQLLITTFQNHSQLHHLCPLLLLLSWWQLLLLYVVAHPSFECHSSVPINHQYSSL